MYATITDWQVEVPETPESFCENVKTFFEDFKNIGAINLRFVKTGKNTARTMTLWPDEETASYAIEAIEAFANSITGVKFTASEKGPVLGDFS